MNQKKYNIEEEIQKTMDSINSIERVEGNPFLFTRLEERLRQEASNNTHARPSRLPVWQIAMVAALLFINGFGLLQSGYFNTTSTEMVGTIDDFAVEYSLADNEEDLDYLNYNE